MATAQWVGYSARRAGRHVQREGRRTLRRALQLPLEVRAHVRDVVVGEGAKRHRRDGAVADELKRVVRLAELSIARPRALLAPAIERDREALVADLVALVDRCTEEALGDENRGQ